jgi:RES domain-containing protein
MAARRGRGKGKVERVVPWYRVVIKTRTLRTDVLPRRAGRFHEDMGTEPTTYAADTVETAWREVAAHLGSVPANPAGFRLYRLSGRNLRLVDLSNARLQKRHRITAEQLRSDPPSPRCLEVAREIRAAGYHGILYPSVRNPPEGQCVVLFLEHLDTLLQLESTDEEWAQFIAEGRA